MNLQEELGGTWLEAQGGGECGGAGRVPPGKGEEAVMQTIVAIVRSKAEGLGEDHRVPLHLGLRGNK